MADLEQKARDYLAAGKVRVVDTSEDLVRVHVTGSNPELDPYHLHRRQGVWTCDCPARVPVCAHILAAQLVTVPVDTAQSNRNSPLSAFEAQRDQSIDDILNGL